MGFRLFTTVMCVLMILLWAVGFGVGLAGGEDALMWQAILWAVPAGWAAGDAMYKLAAG